MIPTDNEFQTRVTLETGSAFSIDDEPFRILLLGDWSGDDSLKVGSKFPRLLPVEVDRDNFDEIIKGFNLKLELDLRGDKNNIVSLNIQELDDFHPDNIFQQLPCFSHLRILRRKLLNADTFNSAANEVRSWFDLPTLHNAETLVEPNSDNVPDADTVNLLDQILDQTTKNETVSKSENIGNNDLNIFVRELARPFLVHTDEVEQADLLSVVDEATGEIMREILHHPKFQNLESAWRGLYFLVKRIETDTELKLFICDISKNRLSAELKFVDSLSGSSVYKLLVNEDNHNFDGQWAVVGGYYDFNLDVDDAALLIRLAQISDTANTPFISSVKLDFFGDSLVSDYSEKGYKFSSDSEKSKIWEAVRSIPAASRLGLVFPRFLGRLPFGEETDSIENFIFEEFRDLSLDNEYLWINPVIAEILLLAQSFQINGWQMGNSLQRQIDNIPLHIYQIQSNHYKKILEYEINEAECLDLLELGIMPLITFHNTDTVRLARFQSVKKPFTPLNGKWD